MKNKTTYILKADLEKALKDFQENDNSSVYFDFFEENKAESILKDFPFCEYYKIDEYGDFKPSLKGLTVEKNRLGFIKMLFEDIIQKYNIDKTKLLNNGGIVYANANDGTLFDYQVNNCLCEFMIYYDTQWGAIKISVCREKIYIYIYDYVDYFKPYETIKIQNPYDLQSWAYYMHNNFDKKGKWDTII